MDYCIKSTMYKKNIKEQADIIRNAVRVLHNPNATKEMISEAQNQLSEFFPSHGQWISRKNEYYGIPEMKMDRLDPEEMQQEVYLAMVENLHRISEDILTKNDEAVVRMTKAYISRYMDAAAKRYVEKKNNISKYYATCVLHMYKYHDNMTIQGHTREEIAAAVRDVYPNRPMTGYQTAEKLIEWSNRQLEEKEVSISQVVIPYNASMEYDDNCSLHDKICGVLTEKECIVFDLLEDGMSEKEIKEALRNRGFSGINVFKAVRIIRTAAIVYMSEQQIAEHKKAQNFCKRMQKKEYRRLKVAAMI